MSKRSAGQGGVCGRVFLLLPPFGEIVLRQDSPRPSGTPLINAGGKGAVLCPSLRMTWSGAVLPALRCFFCRGRKVWKELEKVSASCYLCFFGGIFGETGFGGAFQNISEDRILRNWETVILYRYESIFCAKFVQSIWFPVDKSAGLLYYNIIPMPQARR